VLVLDDDRLSLRLHNGSVAARVRDLANAGEVDVTTDAGRFIIRRAGAYRFDHRDHTSHATVGTGQVRYEGPNSALAVNAGQRAEFWIDTGGVAQYSLSAPANDAFATWNGEQDRRSATSVSAQYVSPEMTGASELDRYGRWEQNAEYGALWIPYSVGVGWAPYSHGHWAWVRPWGWTWVDDAPWGFAPFHYGRWVHVRNTWCWTPGARVVRPVYAPALVAWIGGPRVSVSVNIGGGPSVGWFPLAPREVYVPSYRVSPRYVQNINITHVTNVTQITRVIENPNAPREFHNRRAPHAITVVPAGVMTERKPVAPAAAQMRPAPWVRQLATTPGPSTALVAPPVVAPVVPARPDAGAVRLPPGAGSSRVSGGSEPPAFGSPGVAPRERDADERRNGSRESPRTEPSAPRVPAAQPWPAQPAAPAPPAVPGVAQPARSATAPVRPDGPTMRTQPVKRVDDRPEPPPRADERRGAPRPESPTVAPTVAPAVAPAVAPPVTPRAVEAPRPTPVTTPRPPPPTAPRQVETSRPTTPAAPRPAEGQRTAPSAAPPAPAAAPAAEAKKAEPRPPAEPQKDGTDQKRGKGAEQQR
jgi:hypothetical protein